MPGQPRHCICTSASRGLSTIAEFFVVVRASLQSVLNNSSRKWCPPGGPFSNGEILSVCTRISVKQSNWLCVFLFSVSISAYGLLLYHGWPNVNKLTSDSSIRSCSKLASKRNFSTSQLLPMNYVPEPSRGSCWYQSPPDHADSECVICGSSP